METEAKQLVNDPQAEKAVLAAILENNENLYGLQKGDTKSLFYDTKNQRIFEAAATLIKQGEKADILTLTQYFEAHPDNRNPTPVELIQHTDVPTTADIKQQLAVLRDLRDRRKIWITCTQAAEVGWNYSKDTDEARVALSKLMEQQDTATGNNTVTMAQAVTDLGNQIKANRARNGIKGMLTGFKLIDQSGGFHPGDLTIIAGETSQGKTALAITIAANTATAGNPLAVFSMEMGTRQLTARIMAARTGIDASTMLYRPLTETQEQTYERAGQKAKALPIYFDENSTSSLEAIIASIKTLHRKHGIKAAVIDYLQILGRNTREKITSEEQFFGDAARRLKNLAKELDICVIALSQLSRDRQNPEPKVSRLRASGQIEEAADNVLLIYRAGYYGRRYPEPFKERDTHNTAELILAKGRNIGTGAAIIGFKPELTCFYDYEGEPPTMDGSDPLTMGEDDPF